jgi:hypothetical protein
VVALGVHKLILPAQPKIKKARGQCAVSASTPPVEQAKEHRSRDKHQKARGLWHGSRRRIERVRSHHENFFAVIEAVPVSIWV